MKDYYSTHKVGYEQPSCRGYTSLDVLPFLIGRKWDEKALAFVHALRPSSIRVTLGETTSDSRCWRVTVFVDVMGFIERVEQEVEVGLDGTGWRYGQDAYEWEKESAK